MEPMRYTKIFRKINNDYYISKAGSGKWEKISEERFKEELKSSILKREPVKFEFSGSGPQKDLEDFLRGLPSFLGLPMSAGGGLGNLINNSYQAPKRVNEVNVEDLRFEGNTEKDETGLGMPEKEFLTLKEFYKTKFIKQGELNKNDDKYNLVFELTGDCKKDEIKIDYNEYVNLLKIKLKNDVPEYKITLNNEIKDETILEDSYYKNGILSITLKKK